MTRRESYVEPRRRHVKLVITVTSSLVQLVVWVVAAVGALVILGCSFALGLLLIQVICDALNPLLGGP